MRLNVEKIRKEFPLFGNGEKGGVVYFDNACMTLRPRCVIEAVRQYYELFPSCGERSMHRLGKRVDAEVARSRSIARKFFGAKRNEEIIFTSGTTHAINIVAHSFPFKKGDVVVTTDKEHNSNLLVWQQLAKKGVVRHVAVPFGDVEALSRVLEKGRVGLVSMVYTSNADGSSIPVKDVIRAAHKHGVPVLLDGAQAAPHRRVDVRALDVDFFACSGHKMLGPSGTGLLYGKKAWLERLVPALVGGGTVVDATLQGAEFEELPHRFEAGLQNYAGIIGLGAAMEFLLSVGLSRIHDHEVALTQRLEEGLREFSHRGVRVIGPSPKERGGVTSFFVEGVDVHQVALLLDESGGFATRSGRHCVHAWFNKQQLDGTVRVSFYLYNTMEEVESFLEALRSVLEIVA
ncbi:cysteine desulfurase [Candidatus Woesearchaeota archaeon]|nr:MAG: cysteine desulfurase [Candidatus Woesearchaeota archaeon]